MNKFETILVTGGAGAIGSQTARKLLERGYRVVIVDDESSGHKELVPNSAEYIKGTIESDDVLKSCFEQKIDGIIHCAALFANQNSVDHPIKDLSVNGLATIKLLEYAQKYNVKKILYTSSSCVYGKQEIMVEGNPSIDLDTPYGISKLLGEQYCNFWSKYHKLNTVIIRIFNNYGPSEIPGQYRNVIPNFFKLAIDGKPLPITGDGNETRDFNYVDDTTDGILLAMFNDTKPGDVFNIGSGKETKIVDLALLINSVVGNIAGLEFKPSRSWDHIKRRKANTDYAKEILGYMPKVKLQEGLEKTKEWFFKNRDLVK